MGRLRAATFIKSSLITLLLSYVLDGQPLPVDPMTMDPDQLLRSLRDRSPVMPQADCHVLGLEECDPRSPLRVRDVSIRWVQLDNDPELEAVLTVESQRTGIYGAHIFDKGRTWNLVGSCFGRIDEDDNGLIRIQRLTDDSPTLILCVHDLGGSASVIITTEAYQLRNGKLWPVFEITNYERVDMVPSWVERRWVGGSANRLVIHTIREEPPGVVVRNRCEVQRWDPAKYKFVPAPADANEYCDPKTGKPIDGKSFGRGLPAYP